MQSEELRIVLEIQYCPTLAWYIIAKKTQRIYIEIHENYNKRSYRNKMTLLSPNGLEAVSIPLKKGKHGGQAIVDVEISYDEDWQKNHLRLIQAAYGQSPYYEHYMPHLKPLLEQKEQYLYTLCLSWIKKIEELIALNVEYKETQSFEAKSAGNTLVLRDCISPKRDVTFIENEHLKKYEHPYAHLVSEQEFMKLSILDLLFYFGPEANCVLKQYYD